MITVELNENAEHRLRANAQARGLPAEAYAKELLEGLLLPNGEHKRDGGHRTEAESAAEPFPVLEGYVPALAKEELY
jgi:hypothetical protein